MKFTISKETELNNISIEIIQYIKNSQAKLINLSGNLGAGKTTLVKYILKNLGYTGHVTSPTFGIVNEYGPLPSPPLKGREQIRIYHMDFYREILNINELEEIYSRPNNLIFIEWLELAEYNIQADVNIQINLLDNNSREITVS